MSKFLAEGLLLMILLGAVVLFYMLIFKYVIKSEEPKKEEKGFTLIEFLICVAITVIMLGIAVPQIVSQDIICKSNSGTTVYEGKAKHLHEPSTGIWRFTNSNGENVQVTGFCSEKKDSGYRNLN